MTIFTYMAQKKQLAHCLNKKPIKWQIQNKNAQVSNCPQQTVIKFNREIPFTGAMNKFEKLHEETTTYQVSVERHAFFLHEKTQSQFVLMYKLYSLTF